MTDFAVSEYLTTTGSSAPVLISIIFTSALTGKEQDDAVCDARKDAGSLVAGYKKINLF